MAARVLMLQPICDNRAIRAICVGNRGGELHCNRDRGNNGHFSRKLQHEIVFESICFD